MSGPADSLEYVERNRLVKPLVVDLQLSPTTSVMIAVAEPGRVLALSLRDEHPSNATRAKSVAAREVTTRDYPTLKLKSKQTNKEKKNLSICKQTSATDK